MVKPNMKNEKNPMPHLTSEERRTTFREVALGYDELTAIDEALRCLNCKNMPCVSACPVNIHIPEFIDYVKKGDFEGAYRVIEKSSSLPAICGRVCPQECQCESKCVRGIKGEAVGIGRLERFVADWHRSHSGATTPPVSQKGKRIAVVGSGPSGLACATDLAKAGYSVTVFEALHRAGGVLVYGIPEFRLPKDIVKCEIENLKALGVSFVCDTIIGKTLTVDQLFEDGYSAVFIGTGAGLPSFMGIPGEHLKGVYSANEYLTRVNLMKAYSENSDTPMIKSKRVAVIGGGNVAMDAARCAVRMGADKVYIVYRRSIDELPARREEVVHAMEEGVEFITLSSPIEIVKTETEDVKDKNYGSVKAIKCQKMKLGAPDERGRRTPIKIEGEEFILDVDTVIMSIGTSPNPLIKDTTDGLDVNRKGCIVVSETGKTSREFVYAGGDAVTGAATVISAMGAGKLAAKAIDEALSLK